VYCTSSNFFIVSSGLRGRLEASCGQVQGRWKDIGIFRDILGGAIWGEHQLTYRGQQGSGQRCTDVERFNKYRGIFVFGAAFKAEGRNNKTNNVDGSLRKGRKSIGWTGCRMPVSGAARPGGCSSPSPVKATGPGLGRCLGSFPSTVCPSWQHATDTAAHTNKGRARSVGRRRDYLELIRGSIAGVFQGGGQHRHPWVLPTQGLSAAVSPHVPIAEAAPLTQCRSGCTNTACFPSRTWRSRGGPCRGQSSPSPPSPIHS
jgi:hypothetical protein